MSSKSYLITFRHEFIIIVYLRAGLSLYAASGIKRDQTIFRNIFHKTPAILMKFGA